MKMHKEEYEKLLLRFALELSEVGVTKEMLEVIAAQCERAPNVSSAHADEETNRFVYRHAGYMIEASCKVELKVKKCK